MKQKRALFYGCVFQDKTFFTNSLILIRSIFIQSTKVSNQYQLSNAEVFLKRNSLEK